jgi:hypothetical protein
MFALSRLGLLASIGLSGAWFAAGCGSEAESAGAWPHASKPIDAAPRDAGAAGSKPEPSATPLGSDGGQLDGASVPGEPCDGVDNDGDGQVDEGCQCPAGKSQACWNGTAATRGVGACKDGIQICTSAGEFGGWGACQSAVTPSAELCDSGLDEDCDGKVDCEDPDCQPCKEANCVDGVDDDRDELIDCDDPDCSPPPLECGSMSGACVKTVVVKSDGATMSASIGWGIGAANTSRLDTPDTSGLEFVPAAVGAFGATIAVPAGAPPGTEVINIAPGGGYNGYFRAAFTLPASLDGITSITLHGAAAADDWGRAFLNGHPITPPMAGGAGAINGATQTFCVDDASLFQPGTNEFLLSDSNTGAGNPTDAGPSGASFYAYVSWQP